MTTERHRYGLDKEVELTPRITELFGEEPNKKVYKWSIMDFETSLYHVELKSRRYPSTAFETWYVPKCKFRPRDKETVILYHFNDEKFYYYIHTPGDEKRWPIISNEDGQLTYEVPREFWTEIKSREA